MPWIPNLLNERNLMNDEIITAAGRYLSSNLPTGHLSQDERVRATTDALLEYGRAFPCAKVATFVGAATARYDLSALSLAGWSESSSVVTEVEYPYSADELGENVVHPETWSVVIKPVDGKTLVFAGSAPVSSESILIRYTGLHEDGPTNAGGSTVQADHVGAVAKLAAANMALILAGRTSSGNESTISADTFNHVPAAEQWGRLASRLRKEYLEAVGLASGGDSAASAAGAASVGSMNTDRLATAGLGRLTRARRLFSR